MTDVLAQTPEAVAAAALAAEGYADWYRPYQEQVVAIVAAAVRSDRAARAGDVEAAAPAAAAPAPADDGDPMVEARRAYTAALTNRARTNEALGEARATGLPVERLQRALDAAELAVRDATVAYERIVRANRGNGA